MRAEPVSRPHAYHAEGPVWSPSWGGLRYVDMLAGDVLLLGEDGGVSRTPVDAIAACLRPREGGGAVVAGERRLWLGRANDLSDLEPGPQLWDEAAGIRFNEGGCDPAGGFWVGSMAYDQTPGAASLWHQAPDGSPTRRVLDDVTVSNGLGWSPDGTRAYYNDTPTHTVWLFDWDPQAGLTNRRPFVDLGEERPDGLTVDAEGGVWVALFGGGAVRRYDPSGALSEVVEVEPSQVTACAFGGDDLGTLFVTTSREKVPDGEQPLAGAVFTATPGVRGLPVLPFRG